MDILALCPFSVGALLWEAKPSQWSLTVCVKATFSLVHGGDSVIAPAQDPIHGDRPWDDDPGASLFAPDDLAPLKPRVDIVLAGHAYAPGGAPVQSLVAGLRVGDFSKAVRVTGDRLWVRGPSGLAPGAPVPFVKMPLRHERAARSPDNPVGVSAAVAEEGKPVAPNIEALEEGATPGFGAIAPLWPSRRRLLSDEALRWVQAVRAEERIPPGAAPAGVDFRFFNVAPVDQQIDMLRAGPVLVLENLHPEHPVLETRLPSARPQVFRVDTATGRVSEVALRCDTLFIDSDRGVVTVGWRGLTDVQSGSREAIGRVIVAVDPKGKRIGCERVDRALREGKLGELGADEEARNLLGMRHDAVLPKAGVGVELSRTIPLPTPSAPIGKETPDAALQTPVPGGTPLKAKVPAAPVIPAPPAAPVAPVAPLRLASSVLNTPMDVIGDGTLSASGAPIARPATPFEAVSGATPVNATIENTDEPPPVDGLVTETAKLPVVTLPSDDVLPFRPAQEAPAGIGEPEVKRPPPVTADGAPAVTPPGAGSKPDVPNLRKLPVGETLQLPPGTFVLPALPFTSKSSHAAPTGAPPAIAAPPPIAAAMSGAEAPPIAAPLVVPPELAALPLIPPPLVATPEAEAPSGEAIPAPLPPPPAFIEAAPPEKEPEPPLPPPLPPKPALLTPPPEVPPQPASNPAAEDTGAAAPNAEGRSAVSPEPPGSPQSPASPPRSGIAKSALAASAAVHTGRGARSSPGRGGPIVPASPGPSAEPSESAPELPIEECATISAELTMKSADRAAVLRQHGLSERAWTAIELRWTTEIAKETERGERKLLLAFDTAYIAAQERLGKRVGVLEYARITVAIERGEIGHLLGELDFKLSDLMRIQRVWAKKVEDSPALGGELREAVAVLQKSGAKA